MSSPSRLSSLRDEVRLLLFSQLGKSSYVAPASRSGDNLIGGGRKHELYAVVAIHFCGGRKIEGGELDVFRPTAVLPIILVGVENTGNDNVLANLLAMPIAKDQNRGWKLGWSCAWCGIF